MDYSRQHELFNPETFNTPVHVIGAGATGSWLTLMLAKLGIKDITVWDFDTVAEHNLPNQFFGVNDIGYKKATCLDIQVQRLVSPSVLLEGFQSRDVKVDGTQRLNGIVFLLTDTMSSRKEIFEKALKLKANVKLMIETRMALEWFKIHTIDPTSLSLCKKFEETLFDDSEAQVSACGHSQSVVATAVMCASYAVWQLIKWHNGEQLDNEITLSPKDGVLLTERW